MASAVYTNAKRALLAGEIDMAASGDDIRVAILMTTTTAGNDDANRDATTISGFTTLGEYNGSGYVRKAFTSEAVAADNPNNRGEFDGEDLTWTALGAGTNSATALLLYKHVTDDTDSIPIAYIDVTDFAGNGGDVTVQWNAEGILQLT